MIKKILKTSPAIMQKIIIAISFLSGSTLQAQIFPPDANEVRDLNNGAKVWAQVCVRCHNLREPSEFSDYEWKSIITHMRIRAGLTGKDAREIEAFIMASNDPVLPANITTNKTITDIGLSGEEIYKSTCISCHGANGKGVIPGVPDFTKTGGRLSKTDEVLFKHAKEGFHTPGNAMAMPPKGGNTKLSDNDIKSAIKYLHRQFGGT
jgi:cytochrome c5